VKRKTNIEKDRNQQGREKCRTDVEVGEKIPQNEEQMEAIKRNTGTETKILKSPALWLCVVWVDVADVSKESAA
jgi:hypothetical protein